MLRSVDSLFVPLLALLLVVLGALCLHVLIGRRRLDATAAPTAAAVGIGALFVGGMLAWGHGLWSSYVYLQALGPAVGAILLAYAFTLLRPGAASLTALRVVAGEVVLVSLFWATSEYADARGRALAAKLAADLKVNPQVTIFSKENLGIRAQDFGDPTCPLVQTTRSPKAAYRYQYDGLTLLLRSGEMYFVTATPSAQGAGLADVVAGPGRARRCGRPRPGEARGGLRASARGADCRWAPRLYVLIYAGALTDST